MNWFTDTAAMVEPSASLTAFSMMLTFAAWAEKAKAKKSSIHNRSSPPVRKNRVARHPEGGNMHSWSGWADARDLGGDNDDFIRKGIGTEQKKQNLKEPQA